MDITINVSFDPHPEYLSDSLEIDEISIPGDFYYIDEDECDIELTKHWNEN
ncbi:hypothetical protein ACFOET_11440 [Parapedobacter deserti]|uniref:Uncharacterized protein n=1 Tax=Parapedobacter deserti TaxID=1912957 RepID=A0ABV7JJE6_9SPHI